MPYLPPLITAYQPAALLLRGSGPVAHRTKDAIIKLRLAGGWCDSRLSDLGNKGRGFEPRIRFPPGTCVFVSTGDLFSVRYATPAGLFQCYRGRGIRHEQIALPMLPSPYRRHNLASHKQDSNDCSPLNRLRARNSPAPLPPLRQGAGTHRGSERRSAPVCGSRKEKGQHLAGPKVSRSLGGRGGYGMTPSAANCVATYYRREGGLLYSAPNLPDLGRTHSAFLAPFEGRS